MTIQGIERVREIAQEQGVDIEVVEKQDTTRYDRFSVKVDGGEEERDFCTVIGYIVMAKGRKERGA